MTLKPNQIIDKRYKVTQHLGQGGMGVVWKAVDQQAGGDVVIKMPLDDSNPIILQRFGNEAMMMRQHSTGNPNILDIQGMGDIDGIPYYVMRFLSGGSLEDRCPIVDDQGQPDFRPESYEWLRTIAKALDFLHSKDVLHRDVKPGNILFNESGDAYLVDFGIVKSPLEASSFTSAPTAANTSPGTIEYMPPEVLMGEADALSGLGDQYALAVTLYEMIVGKRPFTGPTETAIYSAITKGPEPLIEVKAGTPKLASDVVARALNSDPNQRFQTCREFASAFVAGLRPDAGVGPVAAPPVIKGESADRSDDGTRELDLENYRKNLKKEKEGSGNSGRDAGGKLFPLPPKASPKVPATVEGGGLPKTLRIGATALFLVCLLLGGLFVSGVFDGTSAERNNSSVDTSLAKSSKANNQPPNVRPDSSGNSRSAASVKPDFTNSIGMEFQLISADSFMMGSPADEAFQTQHRVEISRDFYLGKFEVTQGQWKSMMGTEPWKGESHVREGDDFAATYVSWDDAVAFCKKLSAREGVKYRLPSEAEWEYACRGGTQTTFSFGNDASELGDFAWYDANARDVDEEYAHKVGEKRSNGFGLHDMHGNVWELCSDWFGKDYYNESPKRDPIGPNGGTNRICRGGCWLEPSESCRSASRGINLPDDRVNLSLIHI